MSNMLSLNATEPERKDFKIRELETRIAELEAVVLAFVSERVSPGEADGWRDALEKLSSDFTPHLGMVQGRGARVAKLMVETPPKSSN